MKFLSNTCSLELDNGFRIYFLHRPGPAVEMQLHVMTGSVHEGKFLGCGLSHFLEHMLFQGSRDFPGRAVSDTVTALGGDLNAYTGCDRTCYRMTLPADRWRQGVDMLSSMVRFPELPAERFNSEKEVILRECERSLDNVGNRMLDKFLRTMFLNHPLRHPIIGYKELIATVSREMALEYHAARYTPDRSFAVVVGNCDAEALCGYFEEKFADWQRSSLEEIILPDEKVPAGGREGVLIYPDPLSRLMWGVQAPELGDPRLPAADVLFGILGTGEGSLLNTHLVIRNRTALNSRSFCFPVGNRTLAGVSLECEPGKLARAERELNGILEDCAAGRFSAARMEREKAQQYADRLRSLRNILSVAGEIAEGVMRTGDPGAGDKYIARLQQVDINELKQCASELLASDRWIKLRQVSRIRSRAAEAASAAPCIRKSRLSNGASLIWSQDKSLPLCCFTLILPGGTIFEAPGKSGISQLCAAMMGSEINGMGEEAVLRRLDELCVDIDISSGANSIMLDFSVPRKRFAAAVGFIGRLLGEAVFSAEVLERERCYLLERLKVRSQQPVKAAFDRVHQQLYGDHPYAAGTAGKYADIEKLTVDDVKDFYRRLWVPEQIGAGFAGDCSFEEATALAERFFEAVSFASPGRSKLPERPEFPAETAHCEMSLPREQTVAVRTLPGAALDEVDTVNALEILSMMENGLGATLFKVVREEHALSYSVGMTFTSGFHPGLVSFYAMTTPGAGTQVLELFEAEIKRLADGCFSDAEFEAARKGAAFECELNMSKPETLLRNAMLENYYGFDPEALPGKSEMIRKFSKERFAAILKKIFSANGGCSVLVLPEQR